MASGDKEFHCPNEDAGCSSQLCSQSDLDQHVVVCGFALLPCPQACKNKVLRKNLISHLSNECPLRPVSCPHCKKEVCEEQLKEHEAICDHKLVTCEFCSTAEIPFKELDEHYKTCESKPRDCPMKPFGCAFQGPLKELEEHSKDINSHFFKLVETVKNLQAKLEERNNDVEKLKRDNLAIKAKLKGIEGIQQKQLKELESTKLLNDIYEPPKVYGWDSMEPIVIKSIVDIWTENQWKIPCYGAIKKQKDSTFVWSKSLYTTGEKGHFFALGMFVSKHSPRYNIGLFMSIHKGKYDDEVEWPFPYTVTFKILSHGPPKSERQQNPVAKEICSFSYKTIANEHKEGFLKPKTLRNKNVGKPFALSLQELENPAHGYIKDDSIIFIVEVK